MKAKDIFEHFDKCQKETVGDEIISSKESYGIGSISKDGISLNSCCGGCYAMSGLRYCPFCGLRLFDYETDMELKEYDGVIYYKDIEKQKVGSVE